MSLSIRVDNPAVGRLAAQTFLSKGYEEFAYCGFTNVFGDRDRRSADRYAGFRDELLDNGIAADNIRHKVYTGHRDLANWLRQLPRHTAICAFSDQLAIFIMIASRQVGIEIPNELVVIGVDNDHLFHELARPSLSSVEVDFKDIGYRSMQSLAAMIRGESKAPFEPINVSAKPIRENCSTRGLATDSNSLKVAAEFIRANLSTPISADEVADAAQVSRRTMEYQFKSILNTSPRAYIEQLRLNETKRQLVMSKQTVEEIAAQVGFKKGSYLTQVFRTRFGRTPIEYRRAQASSLP